MSFKILLFSGMCSSLIHSYLQQKAAHERRRPSEEKPHLMTIIKRHDSSEYDLCTGLMFQSEKAAAYREISHYRNHFAFFMAFHEFQRVAPVRLIEAALACQPYFNVKQYGRQQANSTVSDDYHTLNIAASGSAEGAREAILRLDCWFNCSVDGV